MTAGLQLAAVRPLPPSIDSPHLLLFLVQLGLLLALATGLGRLAARVGMPAVVGELGAGVLLGPSLLGLAAPGLWGRLFPADAGQTNLLDAVGQLGVLLLVTLTGISVDLRQARRTVGATGWVAGFGLVVPLLLGVGLGLVLPRSVQGPHPVVTALFLGVALCVSAIPVIARILLDLGLLAGPIGQRVMTAAVLDDLVGWLLLSVVSAMAGAGFRAGHLAATVAELVGVLLVVALLTPRLVQPLWDRLEAGPRPGVATAVVVTVAVLFGAGSAALGMEPILGGLVAGLMIGAVARRGEFYERWCAPLSTVVLAVLAPVFFATAGLRIDLAPLAHPAGLAVAAAVLIVAVIGKFGGVYLGARIGRLSHWQGVALGAGLNARGVIQIVVASVGLRLGILGEQLYTAIIFTAVVTSVLAGPWMSRAVRRITAVEPIERLHPATTPESRSDDDDRDNERAGVRPA